jgi:hypothetical protein
MKVTLQGKWPWTDRQNQRTLLVCQPYRANDDHLYLSVHGPRGGYRVGFDVTPEAMRQFCEQMLEQLKGA